MPDPATEQAGAVAWTEACAPGAGAGAPEAPAALVAPTMAPLWLGAIAAAYQAKEIDALLRGETASSILGLELYHDLGARRLVTTRLTRNPACLFDHAGGGGEPIADLRVAELFDAAGHARSVRALHRRFVRPASCARCGEPALAHWRFATGLHAYAEPCSSCGSALAVTAIDLADGISADDVRSGLGGRRLSELGLGEGDLLLVETSNGLRLFELRDGCDEWPGVGVESPGVHAGSPGVHAGYHLPRTVVIVGLGNIGSNLVDDLVRGIPMHPPSGQAHCIERLVLIDPDRYEDANLSGQRIDACDAGRPKAVVQARRARALRPFLGVVAYVARAEEVPPGVFARAIVAGCVDSRAARVAIAETAWRVGSPFVDAAVDAQVPAVRIAGYMPGPANADIECAFDADDYAALEQTIPCGR